MEDHKPVKFFPKTVTKQQASDTGMAMVLILLLAGLITKKVIYYKIAIPVLIVNMALPMFYYYFAILWLGLSQILGTVVSKILLTAVYVIVLIPAALLRKASGKDPLQLTTFKKSSSSVMKMRDHSFTSKDIEKPY